MPVIPFVAIGVLALIFVNLAHASPSKDITLIVGGENATKGEFPWMIDIRRGSSHTCGASIVNAEWVATSARCVQGAVTDYILVAGDHDNLVEEGTEQRRSVDRIVNHPQYAFGGYTNDIALMKVSEPFVFNSWVGPVPLAASGFAPTPRVVVAGWGRTSETGAASRTLLKVDIPSITDEVCRVAYGQSAIEDSMICAGQEGKDNCQGDSGGPLMCNTGTSNFLCGIVSWGTGCARPAYPGVYTEMSYFTTWVNSIVST